jgi:hypothetical protein
VTVTQIIRRAIPRAALLLSLVALPILAMPAVNAGDRVTIDAPSPKKMGMGLVLMVSLQRHQ